MIGLNEELAARHAQGKPVKIGLIGAGQMGVDVVAQVKMSHANIGFFNRRCVIDPLQSVDRIANS